MTFEMSLQNKQAREVVLEDMDLRDAGNLLWGHLSRFERIERLTLENCQLQQFQPRALNHLKHLSLENNKLEVLEVKFMRNHAKED